MWRAATSGAKTPLWPPGTVTAHHGRFACVGVEGPLSVFFSVWVWRRQPHSGELVDAALPYLSRCLERSCLPALGLMTVVASSLSNSCALKGKAEETVLARDDLRPLHRDDLCADLWDGVFRVLCWLGTQSWRLHSDVGTRDRRCATGRSGRG